MNWETIEAELRRRPAVTETEIDQVMARVHETAMERAPDRTSSARANGATRWNWLLRPVPLTVRPVYALAALLLLAVGVYGSRSRRAPPPRAAAPVIATTSADSARPVQFVVAAADAREVYIVGDFNDWSLTATPLHRQGGDGMWAVVVPLAPGRHVYSFVIDGKRWMPDATAPRAPDSEFGGTNSVVLVERSS